MKVYDRGQLSQGLFTCSVGPTENVKVQNALPAHDQRQPLGTSSVSPRDTSMTSKSSRSPGSFAILFGLARTIYYLYENVGVKQFQIVNLSGFFRTCTALWTLKPKKAVSFYEYRGRDISSHDCSIHEGVLAAGR